MRKGGRGMGSPGRIIGGGICGINMVRLKEM
jgi:hypothetical protein